MFKQKIIKTSSQIFLQIILLSLLLTQIFPIVWLVYSSFKTNKEILNNIFALPEKLQFVNYINAWNHPFSSIKVYFTNSVIVSAISLLVLIILASLTAYAMAKHNFPGKNLLMFILIIIMGLSAYSILIPLYFFIVKLELLNNYLGLVLCYVGFSLPFSIILLHSYFKKFPNEIIEAAKLDGCNELKIFLYIVVPISKGSITGVAIINFIGIWNGFLFSLVIMKSSEYKTLPVGMFEFTGMYRSDWALLFASLVISIIPTAIFFIIFQRNIIEGMSLGSVKG